MHQSYIGLDCLSLPENFSGAGYYMYYLIRALLKNDRDFSIAVFCKPKHAGLFSAHLHPDDKIVSIPLKNRIQRLYFYEFSLEKTLIEEGVSLFHATHYLCPPANKKYKIVTTFHDMGFFLFPNYYPFSKRLFFTKRMSTFLNRSNKIIAISNSTRNDIAKFFPKHAEKIRVIYPGADHLINKKLPTESSPKLEKPTILAVNAFERRKNIPFIIRVFDRLKEIAGIEHQLIIIGHFSNDFEKILKAKDQSNFSRDIQILKSIPIDQLIYFYRNSDFFINASFFEGFGFSPLEAINFSLPAFLYNNAVIEELLENHPYAFTGFDIENWARHIHKEMTNNFPNKILPDQIRQLSWETTAIQFIEMYHKTISTTEAALVS